MPLSLWFAYLVVYVTADVANTVDIAREVEGGVQILKTGPIQLYVPGDILSFTIKNAENCRGVFKICYVSEPLKSRDELRRHYRNVGGSCPQDSCTIWMDLDYKVGFGLGTQFHDNTFYGLLVERNSNTCPRYIVDGRSNFTVWEMPNCPVIADGAQLPKDEETINEKKNDSSMKWVIAICVGLGLLLLIAVVVGVCLCLRLKRKPVHPANSVWQVQQSTLPPKSNRSHKKPAKSNPRSMTSPFPRTPPSKTYNSESKLQIPRNSPHSKIRQPYVSDSATSNDTV